MNPDTSPALEQLQKSIQTFAELSIGAENRDKLWQYSDAFMSSIRSILEDKECGDEEKRQCFDTTLTQFTAAMKTLFENIISQAAAFKLDAARYDVIAEM